MHLSVSIIVPNYNHAAYLRKRLDSVFNQTYQNFEVILLDDASTDNSVEILKDYSGHPSVSHFIVNKINSGSPFRQWKKGIELANGDYIWIAESDDWAELHFLESMVRTLESDHSIGVSYCQSMIVDKEDNIIRSNLCWTDDLDSRRWQSDFTNTGREEIRDFMSKKNVIPNASAAVFKNILQQDQSMDIDRFRMLGDWHLWTSILRDHKVQFIASALNYFRAHDD